MSAILNLLIGAGLFFGGHLVLSAAALRAKLVASLGERGFRAAYSAVALIGLVWLALGYRSAPREPWWEGSRLAFVPLFAMLPAALLLVGAFTQRNPTAVGQERSLDAGTARGVLRITRHPFLWAVALWAGSHLAVNGNFPSLVLFGGMLVLALRGTVDIDRRRRDADAAAWGRFAAVTSNLPFAAAVAGRTHLSWSEIGWRRGAAALLLYAVLIALHPWVIGVSPMG